MNKNVLIVLAILLPPVSVFLHKGIGLDVLINLILCCVFFIPGVIHALWIVTRK